MRQYRGQRKDNGEWVKGWYFVSDSSLRPEPRHYIIVDKVYDSKSITMDIGGEVFACYVVIPSTVGQSTGLCDKKNGKEIYAGDIIRYTSSSRTWMVEFCEGAWKTTELPWDEENEPANRYELFGWDIPCEVISNIHCSCGGSGLKTDENGVVQDEPCEECNP